MTLREYLQHLSKLVKENPEAWEYEVVYSTDDEGNAFHSVEYNPSIGNFSEAEQDFIERSDSYFVDEEMKENAVCIN